MFLFQKSGTDLVNCADSRDIKLLVQFPGNSILRFLSNFQNCVGDTRMRGCFILKITDCVNIMIAVNLICENKETPLILPQPTQFQPP